MACIPELERSRDKETQEEAFKRVRIHTEKMFVILRENCVNMHKVYSK